MKRLRWTGLFLTPALLLVSSAQAGAAKSQLNVVEKTRAPIRTLAMDGSRVAYVSGGKIHVWNVATGATSVVRGKLGYARVAGEVAISGNRVAWIDRRYVGNTEAGAGALLGEIAVGSPDSDATGIQVALGGHRLVVLKTELHEPSGPRP